MKNHDDREYHYYLFSGITLASFFGVIFLAGWLAGAYWSTYSIEFSWSMLNTDPLKDIFTN
ncbi:hypothetical protein DXT76_08755 [Halobacillus trueperi]|uniref:Uncharacterized protein n=1 Tax=Halobacillus trueperi TaxID=156205 RepID=A0A3D8VQK1_9BACI|nr:hypothetical protein [Halobacillus trueperi]RDY71058.1 hypothetical protein DXT76_08755 [Halobacillus trueperi]